MCFVLSLLKWIALGQSSELFRKQLFRSAFYRLCLSCRYPLMSSLFHIRQAGLLRAQGDHSLHIWSLDWILFSILDHQPSIPVCMASDLMQILFLCSVYLYINWLCECPHTWYNIFRCFKSIQPKQIFPNLN